MNDPLNTSRFECVDRAKFKARMQRLEAAHCRAKPVDNRFGALDAPFVHSPVSVQGNTQRKFHTMDSAEPRFAKILSVAQVVAGCGTSIRLSFIKRLRGIEQQSLVGSHDFARALRVDRQNFKVPCAPGKNAFESVLTLDVLRGRVVNLAILNPNAAFESAVRYFENAGTAGQTLELDQIDQALALHTAEPAAVFAIEQ